MDVLARLSGEHEQLRALLECIETAAEMCDDVALTTALQAAQPSLTDELDAHVASEEAEVFGALEQALGEGLVVPFRAEHVTIRALRDDVLAAVTRGEAPHAAALELCDLILNHQRREDLVLFPSAREAALM
jgi:hemerythrin-like domain-containing protein